MLFRSEEYCREGNVSYVWGEGGGLRMSQVRPATHVHPLTGEEVWFNQADAFHTSGMHPETYRDLISRMGEEEFPLDARHGDDSAIDPAALAHVRERSEEHTSELQSRQYLVCRLLLEKKKKK